MGHTFGYETSLEASLGISLSSKLSKNQQLGIPSNKNGKHWALNRCPNHFSSYFGAWLKSHGPNTKAKPWLKKKQSHMFGHFQVTRSWSFGPFGPEPPEILRQRSAWNESCPRFWGQISPRWGKVRFGSFFFPHKWGYPNNYGMCWYIMMYIYIYIFVYTYIYI